MIALLLCALALAQAPEEPEELPHVPLAGSTWRMWTKPPVADALGQSITVFESENQCVGHLGGGGEANAENCAPWIVPADRSIHLAFAVIGSDANPVPLALSPLQFGVSMAADAAPFPLREDQFKLVPHHPAETGNLVVLVIDRSGSMYETSRTRPKMEKVVQALLADTTIDGFFPEGKKYASSKVILLTFQDRLTGVGGEPLEQVAAIGDREAYAAAVDKLLDVPGEGWTHLYDAVGSVITEVLPSAMVGAEAKHLGAPTVIVLTDGFNNVGPADTCGDNVEPLGKVLETVAARQGAAKAATIYTVGFGAKLDPAFRVRKTMAKRPTGKELCGVHVGDRIDGGLEKDSIDNVSLEYIARAGNGGVLVSEQAEALAQFISQAGTRSYSWYELWIHMDPIDQQRFRHRILLQLDVRYPHPLSTNVSFFPGPYFDAPSGAPGPDGLSRPAGVAQATVDLLLGLGGTFGLFLLGVGGYHFRRTVVRMAERLRGGADGR